MRRSAYDTFYNLLNYPIILFHFVFSYIISMGTSNSKSITTYNNLRNCTFVPTGNNFKLGDLDVSERQLFEELRRIILIDEILDAIVDSSKPHAVKKPRATHERLSQADL